MRQLKRNFINLLFLFAWWGGGENKIYQFVSFSVYFWKFWLRQGGLSFYESQNGGRGSWHRFNVSVLLDLEIGYSCNIQFYIYFRSYSLSESIQTTASWSNLKMRYHERWTCTPSFENGVIKNWLCCFVMSKLQLDNTKSACVGVSK